MNIKGKIVTLRAVELEDMELLRGMLNDPEMEKAVVGWSFPVSKYSQQKWYESAIGNQKNQRYVIETNEDGAVGIATLYDIDWKNRRATHGIKLANKERRTKGIGTDTIMAIMRYAFDELGLHRLDGSWFDDNIASKGVYTKCGWTVEGVKREYVYKGGEYKDLSIVGILAADYYALIKRNHYWEENPGGINKIEFQNDEFINLRSVEARDAELLMTLNNDVNTMKYVVGNPTIVTMDEQLIWMEKIKLEKDKKRFIVQYKNKAVGTIIISDINRKDSTANINIKLLPEVRGKGIGKTSMRQALRCCFEELKLYCITAHVLLDNTNSLALLDNLGFKREGILKNRVIKNGERKDIVSFSILETELAAMNEWKCIGNE